MRHLKLGNRTESPAFFDMAGRFRPSIQDRWYGGRFRIGDKAVIYSVLASWRKTNQNRKLTIIADPPGHETQWACQVPNEWLYGGIADELIEAEVGNELIPKPLGQNLYTQHLFAAWKLLARRPPLAAVPPLPQIYKAAAEQQLKKWAVPDKYVVLSPLFDAKYDRHRNFHPSWWHNITGELIRSHPLVVIGDKASMVAYKGRPLPNCFNLYTDGLSPMQSLALIERSSAYIGGETGMTIWAALMRIPTIACYQFWTTPWAKNQLRGLDTRPISAGAPVVWGAPSNGTKAIVQQVKGMVRR